MYYTVTVFFYNLEKGMKNNEIEFRFVPCYSHFAHSKLTAEFSREKPN